MVAAPILSRYCCVKAVTAIPGSHFLQLADHPASPSVLDMLPPADVRDRQTFKQQLEAQRVVTEHALPCTCFWPELCMMLHLYCAHRCTVSTSDMLAAHVTGPTDMLASPQHSTDLDIQTSSCFIRSSHPLFYCSSTAIA